MNINELDLETIGSWPNLHKAITILIVCILFVGGFYYYVIDDQLKQLERVEAKEIALKKEFTVKAAMSSNLEDSPRFIYHIIIQIKVQKTIHTTK